MNWQQKIKQLDAQADEIINNWSFGALAANLLPPPFDTLAVGTVFAKLGADLAELYEVEMNWNRLVEMGKAISTGISGVAAASWVGSGLLKYIPGMNIWVALLLQPPLVAAIAHSAGHTFKNYYRIRITEGRDLTPQQIQEIVRENLEARLSFD